MTKSLQEKFGWLSKLRRMKSIKYGIMNLNNHLGFNVIQTDRLTVKNRQTDRKILTD